MGVSPPVELSPFENGAVIDPSAVTSAFFGARGVDNRREPATLRGAAGRNGIAGTKCGYLLRLRARG